MSRVAVIGNAGGGKTSLCAKLGAHLGVPVHQLDQLQWKPGGVPAPPEEFAKQHDELISREKWIMDGWGSWESIEQRFAAADTIVFIDHPVTVHYRWLFKRQLPHLIFPGLTYAEKRRLLGETWKVLKAIWLIHKRERPKLIKVLDEHRTNTRVIHIRTPKELNRFIGEFCS